MRIIHVNFDYGLAGIGGASIAASRLHRCWLAAGVDSIFLCTFKREKGENVYEVPRRGIGRKAFLQFSRAIRNLPRALGYKHSIPVNLLSSGMAHEINRLNPDVVHIHWVSSDTISFREICRIHAPVVITLHDLWFLLGVEPYPGRDMRYIDGFAKENSTWLDWWLWMRKQKLSDRRRLCFVGPSEWAAQVAKKSIIGKKHHCFSIPNPIDVDLFHFDPYKVGERAKFTILFGCNGGTRHALKGFDDLRRALEMIPAEIAGNMRVAVFGEKADSYSINGMRVDFFGKISDPGKLVEIYRDADMYAFPSKEETHGQNKIEAMACGLPVVAFDRTACAEGIVHKETGWIVPDGDIAAFRDGILWWFEQTKKGDWMNVRQGISDRTRGVYCGNAVVAAWKKLLENVI